MGIPERIESAKRRDRLTDEDIGKILGVSGSYVSRIRNGLAPLGRRSWQPAADWFGDVDYVTVRDEAEAWPYTGETSPGPETLLAAAEAMAAVGAQMDRHLRQAERLAARLDSMLRNAQQSS